MTKKAPLSAATRAHLPYRPCAGVALFNKSGHVFVGQRKHMPVKTPNQAWQMPQGGIDPGEEPFVAARRELHEETNVTSAQLLAAAEDWLHYDFPDAVTEQKIRNRYRGQKQMWFAMLFTGDDAEIDVANPVNGAHPSEFLAWRWEPLENLPKLIVPFKRDVYTQLVSWFSQIPSRIRSGEISPARTGHKLAH